MKCTFDEDTITSPERSGTSQHGEVYSSQVTLASTPW